MLIFIGKAFLFGFFAVFGGATAIELGTYIIDLGIRHINKEDD